MTSGLALAVFAPSDLLTLGFIGLALAAPVTIIAAWVKIARTQGLRYKWLWALVAIFGWSSWRMNWESGQIVPDLAHVGVRLQLGGPDIEFTLPVIAILILMGVIARGKRPKAKLEEAF